MLKSSPMKLLFESDDGKSASGVTQGNYLISGSLGTLLVDEGTRPLKMITLGSPDGPRARGCTIQPLVDSGVADNVAITIDVCAINPIMAHNAKEILGWNIDKLGTITATSSGLTATKDKYGSTASGSYRACDTIVWAADALGTAMAAAFDPGPVAHSPANDTQGHLIIPDAGGAYGIILDPYNASSSAFNALVGTIT